MCIRLILKRWIIKKFVHSYIEKNVNMGNIEFVYVYIQPYYTIILSETDNSRN
jgi:hypothetical protein